MEQSWVSAITIYSPGAGTPSGGLGGGWPSFLSQEWGVGVADLPWGPGVEKAAIMSSRVFLVSCFPYASSEAMVSWPSLHLFANSGFSAFSGSSLSFNSSSQMLLPQWCSSFLDSDGHVKPFSDFICVPRRRLCCVTVLFRVVSKERVSSSLEWELFIQQAPRDREGEDSLQVLQSVEDERSEFKWLDWESHNFWP